MSVPAAATARSLPDEPPGATGPRLCFPPMEPQQTLLPLEPAAAAPTAPAPAIAAPAQREAFLRERLLAKARASHSESLGHRLVAQGQGPWQTVGPGVRLKLLRESPQGRSMMLEMAAGTRFTSPWPAASQECLLLQGDLQLGPTRLSVGDHLHAPVTESGSGEWATRGGAQFFLLCHSPGAA